MHVLACRAALAWPCCHGCKLVPTPTSASAASAPADDGSVRLWEVRTGRCMRTWQLEEPVACVAWCPSSQLSLAAGAGQGSVAAFQGAWLVLSQHMRMLLGCLVWSWFLCT